LAASRHIVVDPDFGERLLALANQMPVWMADTPANHACLESLSSVQGSALNVTTFLVAGDDVTRWCRGILVQVDLHHGEYPQTPAYSAVEVFGTAATAALRDAFSAYGFTILSDRTDGFRAVR
jgi:hypothetical protein